MSFLNSLQNEASRTGRTENGALTHTTTHNAVLDFFALAGAMRNNVADATKLFRKAFAENPQLAVRALFYIRDIRGGQGERDLFRALYNVYEKLDEEAANFTKRFIPEYGRWDDLFAVADDTTLELVAEQFVKDETAMAKGESVSLLAKWMPSENTSSKATRKAARALARQLGLSAPEYRRRVVALRKYIKLLEHKMSANEWSAIDYSKLPSQAGRKHVKAFKRHDETRYEQYLEDVMSGKVTMNASTLFTYEIYKSVHSGAGNAADAMWKSLPDYTDGRNAIVVADVSGSMYGDPMAVSVSLALYFAEHNSGAFKDYFITFSENPKLQKVAGKNLTERMRNIERSDWGGSTNIQGVFDLLLKAAVKAGADATDMPGVIYIISDMEFNMASGQYGWGYRHGTESTNYEAAKEKFAAAGFTLPHIVFWNVSARNTNVPATAEDGNVTLISGLSQSTFRYAVEGKTPTELMNDVLNSERYSQIVL